MKARIHPEIAPHLLLVYKFRDAVDHLRKSIMAVSMILNWMRLFLQSTMPIKGCRRGGGWGGGGVGGGGGGCRQGPPPPPRFFEIN